MKRSGHILALNETGQLFAWGWNGTGQCGVNSTNEYINSPTRVTGLDAYKVLKISAGECNSLLLCKKL